MPQITDLQFWLGLLAIAGFGNIGVFWYGYGKLNQKVDGINARLDKVNGTISDLQRSSASQGVDIGRLQGAGR